MLQDIIKNRKNPFWIRILTYVIGIRYIICLGQVESVDQLLFIVTLCLIFRLALRKMGIPQSIIDYFFRFLRTLAG